VRASQPGLHGFSSPFLPAERGAAGRKFARLRRKEREVTEQYEVALSFAGEQRCYVEDVAEVLQSRGISIFYDDFERIRLWGRNLAEELQDVYENRAACAVMFISKHYVEKAWPTHERRAILSRAVQEPTAIYVLPVRFDDTPVPGLPSGTGYEWATDYTPAELAAMIAEKIGVRPFEGKASDVPPPRMTSRIGEAVFDYSGYGGRYRIGRGLLEFETKWGKASDREIHVYNDPPSINGVARVPGCTSIAMVSNAAAYDYTSRVQTIPRGEIAVWRNVHGFYAAVHVLDIKDASRQDRQDEVRFQYAIQSDGSDSFGNYPSN